MAPAEPEGRGIVAHFARHRTLANLLLVVLILAGLFGASRMRAQYFPDTVVAEIAVSVDWPGAGAEDVDRGLVQVMEPALLAINGVTDVVAEASEGSAQIALEFEPGHDLAQAAEDVQAALDTLRDLPEDAETPVVRRSAWRDRVTDVVITGPVSVDQLGRLADEFVARLFEAGVTRATIQGLAATETVVEIGTEALLRHGITLSEVSELISAAVQGDPAGEVEGAGRVRTGAEARTPEALAGLVLRTAANGEVLTLGEVARIRSAGADRARAYFVGDNPAMAIRVDRSDQGDAIGLQATVAEVAAAMRPTLPQGVTLELVRTRAEQITDRLNLLLDNGISGLLLVVGILFLFLNARTALWVAAGIPVAMLAAVAMMWAAGMTLNMISLFGLILMLGIVVDDAIVVGEHADFRARVLGEPPQIAAERGAGRMVSPVVASTLTTVLAFAALTTIGGSFGDMIADIPMVVIFVLLASTVECFLILPNHMAHALAHQARVAWYDWPSRTVMKGFDWFVARMVRPAMRTLVALRYPVLALALVALASQAALFLRGDVQFRFFNGPEQSSVTGNFVMLPGTTRADSLAMMRELQRATEAVAARFEAEHGRAPLTYVLAEVGGSAGRGLAGTEDRDPDQLGGISLELIDPDLRDWTSADLVAALQAEVRPHPKLEEMSFRGGRYGPGGDAISVDLTGAEAGVLKAAAEALKARLAPLPGVSGLEDSLSYDKDELILTLTPQGDALGFTIDSLGRELRARLTGIEAARYPEGPRSAAIRVELPETERTADFLERMLLPTAAGGHVPLADIVTVTRRAGFSAIQRENGQQLVTVNGDLAEDDPAQAAAVQDRIATEILPALAADFGVGYSFSGLRAQENQFLGDSAFGFAAALAGIYLCLAWIFASWTRPLVVMAVIPFGLVGAIWGHHHWGVPLSMFSIVGLIGMSGIIINDAIVLVSTIDAYAGRRGLRHAIVDAVADRLRPVFLTTATTVLGLAPLLFEKSQQAAFLMPTVITLVYGLGFGMVLILVVVPALVAVQGDLGRSLRALKRAAQQRRAGLARGMVGLAALALVAAFALTMAPALRAGEGMAEAYARFAVVAAAITLAVWGAGRVLLRRGR